jgi:hypothetical protein
MQICLFDVLPVELVHTVFNYFWADEILHSFFEISDYINNIIFSYSSHRINFQLIIKSDFEKVCRLIRCDQVISLTLSDNNDTPNQPKLFFSYFDVEQFARLRSLTLLNIDIITLKFIFLKLNKLNQVVNFGF